VKEYIRRLLEQAIGAENAITKDELCHKTRLGERAVRNFIRDLRMEGMVICSTASGAGYYVPKNATEVMHFIREMEKRGRECYAAASMARQWMVNNGMDTPSESIVIDVL
jgi:hypothetical protein